MGVRKTDSEKSFNWEYKALFRVVIKDNNLFDRFIKYFSKKVILHRDTFLALHKTISCFVCTQPLYFVCLCVE